MSETPRRVIAAAVLLSLVACAPSGADVTIADAPESEPSASVAPLSKGKKRDRPDGTTELGSDPAVTGGSEQDGGRTRGGSIVWVARTTDAAGDTEDSGTSPGYVDLRRASIADRGRGRVRFRLEVAAPFEERMSGSTYVYLEFRLEGEGRDVSLVAEGDANGWGVYLGEDLLPGRFVIDGSTMTFTVPWKSVGGRGAFDWYVASSWTRSTLLDTDYSFDRVPDGFATFPN